MVFTYLFSVVSQKAVDLSKVALQFVNLLPREHLKHQYVSAGGEADDWVESGGMGGDTELNHLLGKCVSNMAVVNLEREREQNHEITRHHNYYSTSTLSSSLYVRF